MARIAIKVIARGDELMHSSGPAGFRFVRQWFSEAGLEDTAGVSQPDFWKKLRILSRAVKREFGGQVAIQVIDRWSLQGLWFCARHHIRQFPCVMIAEQSVSLDVSQTEMMEMIRHALNEVDL